MRRSTRLRACARPRPRGTMTTRGTGARAALRGGRGRGSIWGREGARGMWIMCMTGGASRLRRRRTCNAQGLGELGPSRHRLSFADIPLQVGLDVLLARCHRTCQPPRRLLDVVVVPAGERLCRFFSTYSDRFQRPRKAKSTSNVPRSAPVPFAERCDAGPWWVGGDESRARSGAERRCARCAFNFVVSLARF